MTIPDFTREYTPALAFSDKDPTTDYWIRDGRVQWRHYPIPGADPGTFRFYLGSFAKDACHVYCTHSRIRNADPHHFRALNFAYFTDGLGVWTLGGRVPDADAATFVVCDDGAEPLSISGGWGPYGYAKDTARVFYYDFDGKPCLVRKATAETFESQGDHYFGWDHQFVFCGLAALPGARRATWRKVHGYYSTDGTRVYYFNRRIKEADSATFEVVNTHRDYIQLARDRIHCYWNDNIIDEVAFLQMVKDDEAAGTKRAS